MAPHPAPSTAAPVPSHKVSGETLHKDTHTHSGTAHRRHSHLLAAAVLRATDVTVSNTVSAQIHRHNKNQCTQN